MIRLRRPGFGLIELIVAMTILAVGVLGMAAAAVYAQQSFARAEAGERAARIAGSLLDSLTHAPAPVSGEFMADGMMIRWTVAADSNGTAIDLTVNYLAAGRIRLEAFHVLHDAAASN